ncbi:MAG: Trk system potassium transporter TrkA [Treponema sp.]|jgi:trk system potassium uptake protein TrkA|nr:Trk system potassium transporter TrkA [Treponema sp.]
MRIVIAGAGQVGVELARRLIQEKHDVSLIEPHEERARHASNRLDCLVLHDQANRLESLEQAGVKKAGALVAVTDSDELNIIICGMASSLNPKLTAIARVRNGGYARLNLGVDHVINPDVEAARSVLNAVERGVLGDILSFTGTPYEMGAVDVSPASPFDGLAIKDFHSLIEGESLVALADRQGASILPTGTTVLQRGDRIYVLAREAALAQIFKLAGRTPQPLRKIGVAGGGRLGSLIAEGLLESGPAKKHPFFAFLKNLSPRKRRITIIEEDYRRCKELAARFPDALILNEDISDESFVAEERLGGLDLVITAAERQEMNIITAVYLKSKGVARTIALVTGSGYAMIARQLGVDVVIPIKTAVVDSILSRLLGEGIKGIHRIGDSSIGVLDIETGPRAPVIDKPLREFRLSEGGLVMLIYRDGASFIPRGDFVFQAGDRVVLIAKNGSEGEIGRLFDVPLLGQR